MWWIPKLLLIATKMFFARNYLIIDTFYYFITPLRELSPCVNELVSE